MDEQNEINDLLNWSVEELVAHKPKKARTLLGIAKGMAERKAEQFPLDRGKRFISALFRGGSMRI